MSNAQSPEAFLFCPNVFAVRDTPESHGVTS